MVPQKEAKEMLYTLLAEHFVTVQEIPRSQDYAPARTFYLFTVNLSQVATMLLERCYKTAGNVKGRWLSERDEHRLVGSHMMTMCMVPYVACDIT